MARYCTWCWVYGSMCRDTIIHRARDCRLLYGVGRRVALNSIPLHSFDLWHVNDGSSAIRSWPAANDFIGTPLRREGGAACVSLVPRTLVVIAMLRDRRFSR